MLVGLLSGQTTTGYQIDENLQTFIPDPNLSTALIRCFLCTMKGQRTTMRRWLKAGKALPKVSLFSCVDNNKVVFSPSFERCRPVYFRQPWLNSLRGHFRTSNQILKIPQFSIFPRYIVSHPVLTCPPFLFPPILPPLGPLRVPYGLTRSGPSVL